MSGYDKTKYFYAKIPKRLFQSYGLLNPTDRATLAQIISWHPNECFYAVNYFTEVVLGVGDKAFYQSIYKLQLLGLIRFKRGNRKRPNRYLFEPDPRNWRLPKPLSDQIRDDYLKLGFADFKYQHEPFPNEYGFKIVFNKLHPKLAIKIKEPTPTGSAVTDMPISTPELSADEMIWYKKYDYLTGIHSSPTKVVADYYKYQSEISKIKNSSSNLEYEKKYLLLLEEKYFEVRLNPPDEITKKILNLATDLESRGLSGEEIQVQLGTEAKVLRQKLNT